HHSDLHSFPTRRSSDLPVPIVYDDVKLDAGYRLDILVANELILELKSVEMMNPVFEAQLLTYLKLTGKRLGFLINFNVRLIKSGDRKSTRLNYSHLGIS